MKGSAFVPPHLKDVIVISARAEGRGRTLGDLRAELRPGGSFLGWSYEELASLGSGNHDLEPEAGSMLDGGHPTPAGKSGAGNTSPAA
jgi:hypothetical protein